MSTKYAKIVVNTLALVWVFFLVVVGTYYSNVQMKSEVKDAKAGALDNLHGYAWAGMDGGGGAPLGWISLNCTNKFNPAGECTHGNYGVNVNPVDGPNFGKMSGYAWIDMRDPAKVSLPGSADAAASPMGWITFNESELQGCPSGACRAQVGKDDGLIRGWARFCSVFGDPSKDPSVDCGKTNKTLAADDLRGGWDGWISLSCLNSGACRVSKTGSQGKNTYGLFIDNTGADSGKSLGGYAWGGDKVVGFISFNISDMTGGGACKTTSDCLPYVEPPLVLSPPLDFFANPKANLAPGDKTKLTWDASTWATSCTPKSGNAEWTGKGVLASSGNTDVRVNEDSVFLIECTDGKETRQATENVTVKSFDLSLDPASASIVSEIKAKKDAGLPIPLLSNIKLVTFGSYSGATGLSATSDLPTGTTITFTKASLTKGAGNDESGMNISISNAVKNGTYTIVVTGTHGTETHAVSMSVKINDPTNPNGTAKTTTIKTIQEK